MRRRDARVWRKAHSFEDLSWLTVGWLEGALLSHPNGHHGGPDSETRPLMPVLCEAYRGGFLTEGSQPGELAEQEGTLWHQRAYVSGFAGPGLAGVLGEVARQAGLVTRIYLPAGRPMLHGGAVDVTRWGERINTGVGEFLRPRAVRSVFLGCRTDAVEEVLAAWQVTVVDPEWGRNDVLWGTLRRALAAHRQEGAQQ
ncbi:hypothetical protein G6045_19050 [Streptomyces sp. YC504]|uniref:DUF6919 domain-containing protein n=1 Tax=Streptomyces mesophilus TaxID=1775132 RepID=A0A6G4XKN7_9ACTN|nr:hypothetical protein [Streptomyces mesophilus]NGO77742.1 hypothetical protein [Streptomyces mesophilus]